MLITVLLTACGTTRPSAASKSLPRHSASTPTPSAVALVARPLDGGVVAREFAAIGMRFRPTSAAHRASSATAIRAAEADQGLSQYRKGARVVLGLWTNAVKTGATSHESVTLTDDRLVWLVRFTGLSLPSHGRGPVQFNHELNVMVDANTGHVVGSVTYR